jgi:hypothetical protein
MATNDARDALASLFSCVQSTFKRYDRSSRRQAWNALITGKGKEEVNKLLNSPTHQVIGIPRLLKFKEWLTRSEASDAQ